MVVHRSARFAEDTITNSGPRSSRAVGVNAPSAANIHGTGGARDCTGDVTSPGAALDCTGRGTAPPAAIAPPTGRGSLAQAWAVRALPNIREMNPRDGRAPRRSAEAH